MKPCGGPKQGGSRYPRPKPKQTRDGWKAAPPPAAPQFDDYGQRAPPRKSKDDAPFTYAGEHLAACSFPLGGFGAMPQPRFDPYGPVPGPGPAGPDLG